MPFTSASACRTAASEVALVVVGNEMREHFGVGVGAKHDAVGLELVLEAGEVFDDAVVDDGDVAGRRRGAGGRCGRWRRRAWPSACG